jgi:hypothetical protein
LVVVLPTGGPAAPEPGGEMQRPIREAKQQAPTGAGGAH